MEPFDKKYYFAHIKLIEHLLSNPKKIEELQKDLDEELTKEALMRDFASRAYYAVFLSARKTLNINGAVHSTIKNKLSKKYKILFMQLKSLRETADYNTKEEFYFPMKANGVQYYLPRVIKEVEKFLDADFNELTP